MTKYELYICDISGEHKPIAKFVSDTPFMSVSTGDRFDDHGWNRLDGVGKIASEEYPKRYIVHSIKYTVIESDGALLNQYWLNLSPHEGPRSPAWQED
ncbi:hypothetical protein [Kaarinaea lacus]